MRKQLGLVALVVLTTTAGAYAQEAVDVSRLPIDLHKIQRELRQSAERAEHEGLAIRYVVDVFGQAPPIVLFRPEDNLRYGPVPYGAPTHQEMIEHVTPQEYRAPPADISALLRWLAQKASTK